MKAGRLVEKIRSNEAHYRSQGWKIFSFQKRPTLPVIRCGGRPQLAAQYALGNRLNCYEGIKIREKNITPLLCAYAFVGLVILRTTAWNWA